MWTKAITVAAVLAAASIDAAHAQSVDPNPADRGFPAYAQPNFSGYYNGVPQGSAPGVHITGPGYQSGPAALPTRPTASRRGAKR